VTVSVSSVVANVAEYVAPFSLFAIVLPPRAIGFESLKNSFELLNLLEPSRMNEH